MKKLCITTITAAALVTPSLGMAQFNISNVLGGGTSANSNAGVDLGAQQDALTRNYVAAGNDVMNANRLFAEALGIQAQAVGAAATSDAVSANEIEAQDKAISADAAAIAEAMKSGATLKDAESKVKFGKGLVSLAQAMLKYKGMGKDVESFSSGLSGASPLMLPKLQSGAYVIKTLPTSVSNLSTSLKSAIDFARSNGVEIPADATSLL